jgi:hypothetical protein
MKNIFDHIEQVRGKPHHVRKRIALAAAATGAGLVGLVWFVGSVSFGLFAIQGSSFAESAGQEGALATTGENGSSNLAGVAAAPLARQNATNAPAHIEIVDTTPSTPGQRKAEQTIIPF